MNPCTAMPPAAPAPAAHATVTGRHLRSWPRGRTGLLLATALLGPVLAGCTGQAASQDSGSGGDKSKGSSKSCQGTKTADGLTITLSASPCPLHGGKSAKARITVKDGDGKPVKGAAVKVNPEMTSMKMKGGDQTASADGDGYASQLVLGMPGAWKISVHVTPPGKGKASTAAFDFTAE